MPADGARRFSDVRRYGEVDSTNRVVADLARDGAPDGVVVVADHQTAGRGRRGRAWLAPRGSALLVSVLLRPRSEPAPLTTVGAALAAADALGEVARLGPALRWPNDLYADGRKLGGILAEVVDGEAVALGIGINLRWPSGIPASLVGVAVAVEEVVNHAVDRDELLVAFLAHLERRDGALASPSGTRKTLEDYSDRCETLGQSVSATLPGGRTVTGVATGLDGCGRLIVDGGGVRSVLAVADVVHVRPA